MTVTNTLAYYDPAEITAVKSFTVQALALDPYPPNVLEANVIKLFTALSYDFLK